MGRNSVLQLAGGKSPRQRIWEAIRSSSTEFTTDGISRRSKVELDIVRSYMKSLALGGWISISSKGGIGQPNIFTLQRDNGIEAPRVRKDGSEVVQGSVNEAMWGAICVLMEFTSQQIAEISGASPATAKTYCRMLAKAGYLQPISKGKGVGKGGITTVWQSVRSRNSGPRAPMITRLKAVYDPNLHEVAWMEGADDAVKGMDDE